MCRQTTDNVLTPSLLNKLNDIRRVSVKRCPYSFKVHITFISTRKTMKPIIMNSRVVGRGSSPEGVSDPILGDFEMTPKGLSHQMTSRQRSRLHSPRRPETVKTRQNEMGTWYRNHDTFKHFLSSFRLFISLGNTTTPV